MQHLKQAVSNKNLSWAKWTYAKTDFLLSIKEAGYPDDHWEMWAHAFIALENHCLHGSGVDGDHVLTCYMAAMRADYFDWLGASIPILEVAVLN